MKKTLLVFVLTGSFGFAQTYNITQVNQALPYLNPAATGEMGHGRVVGIFKNQWGGVQKSEATVQMPFRTMFVSYDGYLEGTRFGIGVYALNDRMGANAAINEAAAQLSWNIPFNTDESEENLAGGLQMRFNSLNYDFAGNKGLNFVDQFSAGSISTITSDPLASKGFLSRNQLLASAGLIYRFFSKKNIAQSNGFQVGAALHELDRENINRLRWVFNATYNMAVNQANFPDASLAFTALYRKQGIANQIEFSGVYRERLTEELVGSAGGGFRGFPWKKKVGGGFHRESLFAIFGIEGHSARLSFCIELPLLTTLNQRFPTRRAGSTIEAVFSYSVPRIRFKGEKIDYYNTSMKGSYYDTTNYPPLKIKCPKKKKRTYFSI